MNQIYLLDITNVEIDFQKSFAFDASSTISELTDKIKDVIRENVYEPHIEQDDDFEDFEEYWNEYEFESDINNCIETGENNLHAPDYDFEFYFKRFDLSGSCENIHSVITVICFDRDVFLAFNGDDDDMDIIKPFIREILREEYEDDMDFDEYWEASEFGCADGSFWDADDNEWWISHSEIIK